MKVFQIPNGRFYLADEVVSLADSYKPFASAEMYLVLPQDRAKAMSQEEVDLAIIRLRNSPPPAPQEEVVQSELPLSAPVVLQEPAIEPPVEPPLAEEPVLEQPVTEPSLQMENADA